MSKKLTVGNPTKLILAFMMPLFLGNLFQQLYNMADTLIVGRTIGPEALAAVGGTGSLVFLVIGFASGVSTGLVILTTQRFGADDEAGVRRSFAVCCVVGLAVSVLLTVVSVPLTRPLLVFLNTPGEILEQSYLYCVIIFAGIPATMLFNLLASVIRAVGDSRTPLVFLMVACLINIALDYLFIVGFHMGVEGAAIATVLSQLLSGICSLLYLFKRIPILRLTREDWKMSASDIWTHVRLGLPAGFQTSVVAVGTLIVQYYLNELGTLPMAAFAAGQKISNLFMMPLFSFGMTIGTYTAQNYGAGEFDRIRKGVRQGAILSVGFSLVAGAVSFLLGDKISALFLPTAPDAVLLAHMYLKTQGVMYWSLALLFIFRFALQGLGSTLIPTLAGVMELAARGVVLAVLAGSLSFIDVCLADVSAWLGACIVLAVAFVVIARRLDRGKVQL